MPGDHRRLHGWLVAGLMVLAAVAIGRSANTGEPCCYTNQRYSGVCRVVPAEGETCGSILAYLNKPNSSGKGYCNSTPIRGGWTPISCGGSK
jgi:hypothetical protein